ncbi:MAG: M55 family metallopeptidase [Thermomicrobiales bacterium]
MNVLVSVDIEGITGVVHADMMSPEQREYNRGRKLMTDDANAAIEGLTQAGADYILVIDGHGPMRNLVFEDMHPASHLMTGSANSRDHCQLEGADSRGVRCGGVRRVSRDGQDL